MDMRLPGALYGIRRTRLVAAYPLDLLDLRPCIQSELVPDIPRVNASCDTDVGRAFDDGAAVREHRDLMVPAGEPQRELVTADCTQPFKPRGELRKVEWAPEFMDLNGVAAAQADRGAPAVEPGKLVLAATGAIRIPRRHAGLANRPMPQIRREDPAADTLTSAAQDFDRFHRLERPDQARHRSENASRFTRRLRARRRLRINAAETR